MGHDGEEFLHPTRNVVKPTLYVTVVIFEYVVSFRHDFACAVLHGGGTEEADADAQRHPEGQAAPCDAGVLHTGMLTAIDHGKFVSIVRGWHTCLFLCLGGDGLVRCSLHVAHDL